MANHLSRLMGKINRSPDFIRSFLITKLFCSKVKFAGTSGIKILKVSENEVEMKLANKKRVQNHIGGIHAAAAVVLAESTTGMVFGMHVPDSHIPLIKSMTINYQRRMQGDLHAVATISAEQIAQINNSEKGDVVIAVKITDESGQEPIECLMQWAWVSKVRK
ncbi:MAG: DUF4442 domain-containing protein [Alteromonadaceae bacterium]|nr:DUF4442 domain-containing protein [Alteromonadaceae bacterium]